MANQRMKRDKRMNSYSSIALRRSSKGCVVSREPMQSARVQQMYMFATFQPGKHSFAIPALQHLSLVLVIFSAPPPEFHGIPL
jgi:hypothetical protein